MDNDKIEPKKHTIIHIPDYQVVDLGKGRRGLKYLDGKEVGACIESPNEVFHKLYQDFNIALYQGVNLIHCLDSEEIYTKGYLQLIGFKCTPGASNSNISNPLGSIDDLIKNGTLDIARRHEPISKEEIEKDFRFVENNSASAFEDNRVQYLIRELGNLL